MYLLYDLAQIKIHNHKCVCDLFSMSTSNPPQNTREKESTNLEILSDSGLTAPKPRGNLTIFLLAQ